MADSFAAVLEFGSSKVTVTLGEKGINNTYNIKGIGECAYAGFYKGCWNDPDKLGYAISQAVSICEANSGCRIRKLFVGVPADFASCITKEVCVSFRSKNRITHKDIINLFAMGNDFGDIEGCVITDIKPVYYLLDDGRRVLDPIGSSSGKFGAMLSYLLVTEEFYGSLVGIFNDLNIEYYLTSAIAAKVNYLFDGTQRDGFVILFDINASSTTVAVAKGEGILSLYNFALGGNSITEELSEYYEIPVATAETLKRKVILTLSHEDEDTYDIEEKDEIYAFPAEEVNSIVAERITSIGYMIAKCLNACDYDYPSYINYHLSGGGISRIRGAKDILAKQLKHHIELVQPPQPLMDKPHLMTGLALLDTALKLEESGEKGIFLSKIKSLIDSFK